jgi:hypothetical protein
VKTYRDFKQTLMEPTIWEAFRTIRFEFDMDLKPYRLLFDEKKLRQSWRFRELWWIHFPWIKYRVGSIRLDFAASAGQTKMMWSEGMFLSLLRCQDIILCQQIEKSNYREIRCITWKDLWASTSFMWYSKEFLFRFGWVRLTFLCWVTAKSSRGSDFEGAGYFVHARYLAHKCRNCTLSGKWLLIPQIFTWIFDRW